MTTALILAGGSGTRFWPASRRARPKQLLALDGERSLLQETVDRLAPLVAPRDVWVCTTEALASEVRAQLPAVPAAQILAEPAGRNTAPAIGWALLQMPAAARAGTVVVLPADHRIGDPAALRASLAAAVAEVERHDRVSTLGVVPRWAESGFGYLETGELLDPASGLRRVVRFTEKPDAETARRFVAAGRHLWNAGIFVFRGTTLLAALARLAPDIWRGLAALADAPAAERDARYRTLPAISIDYAVMEKLDDVATLPLDCGWNDLGSWAALAEVLPHDAAGNAARGEVVAIDARDNLLVAEQGTIAVLGVEGLVVVRSGDAVLVLPRERAQEVRAIVDRLAATGRGDLL
jgi:mannose-1-phosphate guanylyltransferase